MTIQDPSMPEGAPASLVTAVHKTTAEVQWGVAPADFPTADWLHDPSLSAVDGWAVRYWKIDTGAVALMSAAERAAVDAQHEPVKWIIVDPVMEPVVPGASKVLANDRPAIEVLNGVTGFAAIQAVWPLCCDANRTLRCTVKFVLKASGTGSNVRICAQLKSQSVGEDTSGSWADTEWTAVAVTFTNVGDMFEGVVELDASSCEAGDALALQVGRDGAEDMGAGTADDVDCAVQLVGLLAQAY